MKISDLPHDLVEEILSRVPATSLKRLRPTCKHQEFKDQEFTKKHHRKAAKQSLPVMLKEFKVCPMNVEFDAPSIEFKDALELKGSHSDPKQKLDIAEVFHCDGLLLCTTRCNSLAVWNPCLGETKWVKSKTGYYNYKKHSRFALGYKKNKSCRSYRILRFWDDHHKNPVVEFEMYEFSSGGSWRVLDDTDRDCFIHEIFCGVSLKGNVYWLASDRDDDKSAFLLSFDFTRERFKRMNLPPVSMCVFAMSLVREEEQLSVLHQSYPESKMDLWVTNNRFDDTETETDAALSWSKIFTVGLPIFGIPFPFYVTFLPDEEKKVAVCGRASCWYRRNMVSIIGEDDEYCTQIPFAKSIEKSYLPFIFNYVPSLV